MVDRSDYLLLLSREHKAVKHYEKMKDKGENVYIDTLTYDEFMMLGDTELSRRFSLQDFLQAYHRHFHW